MSALPLHSVRARVSKALAVLIETELLVLVVLSPWAFGSAEGLFEFALTCGVGLLLALWACRLLVDGRLQWSWCPASIALVLLFVQGSLQIIPLPDSLLGRISPTTALWYRELLPDSPEVLPPDQVLTSQTPPSGTTLSVYPTATRQALLRILAILAVFAVVRYNIEPSGGLKRLAIIAAANAVVLSIVALLQSYTSRPDMVYWTFASPGAAFGPFVCRNHFSFYANICFALGFGFLLTQLAIVELKSKHRTRTRHGRSFGTRAGEAPFVLPNWTVLLQRPLILWLSVGLAWILSASLLSLSRGGLLALCGAFFLWAVVHLARTRNVARLLPVVGVMLVVAAASVGLAGMQQLEQRYSATWQTDAPEARLSLWRNSSTLIPQFWTMGSGFGTFGHVEPTSRDSAKDVGVYYDHAHNEYLEALIEGGLPRFLLTLLMVIAPFYAGISLLRGGVRPADFGLILGALLGLATVALHSIGEFGLHIPAITLLATIIASHVLTLWKRRQRDMAADNQPPTQAGWGSALAAVLGAMGAAAIAYVLIDSGFRSLQCQAYIQAALQERKKESERDMRLELQYLCFAESLNPDSGVIDHHIGATLEDMYDHAAADLDRVDDVLGFSQVWSELPGLNGLIAQTLQTVGKVVNSDTTWQVQRTKHIDREQRAYLDPAFRYFIQARNRCPFEPKTHVRLARLSQYLPEINAQDVYLSRAKRLASYNPELWFTCGLLELRAGKKAEALHSFNQSARLSQDFLDDILFWAKDHFTSIEVVEQIFEADPARLRVLVDWRSADVALKKWRGELLRVGAERIRSRASSLTPAERHHYALILWQAGHEDDALEELIRAMTEEPTEMAWPVDYASFLIKRGRFEEARRLLVGVLAMDAKNAQAQELLRNLPAR